MTIQDRRERQRDERHQLIIDTARAIAEAEGWDAVTTRRLSVAIEYSQPVLYSHFAGKDAIVAGVALRGFAELSETLRAELAATVDPDEGLASVAYGYLRLAEQQPAVYAAMFSMANTLTFADASSPAELQAAFAVLRGALAAATGNHDLDTRTEVFWGTLHGLAMLTAGSRLRPERADARLAAVIAQTLAAAG